METTIATAKSQVLLRPSRREDASAYRDLRLDALQRSPAAFGSDYESSAARPMSFWEERMAEGALGVQGVTYLAFSGAALIPRSGASPNFRLQAIVCAGNTGVWRLRYG